ncbi:hypothetical protein C0J45_22423, partial [Silurus meridionalis]
NVALGGIATQSSTGAPYYAHNAIDGNRASNILSSSCTHTNNEYNPWWRVDLLDAYHIFNIIVTNRGDCCSQRLNGAEIHVGYSLLNNGNNNPRCVVISTIPAGASVSYNCNMRGRYVNIIIPNIFQYLTLCEVEVYGTPENVALKGIATQSSLFQNYYAYLAIDGNRASSLYSYSCTHTDGQINSWWRVDLLAKYDISNVIITNRGDAVTTRINGAEIHIGSSLVNNGNDNPRCVVISTIPAGASVNYTCNMRGHYVNIIVPNIFQYLTLCEVEVYGTPANVALGGIATQSSLYTNNFYPNFAIDGKRTSIMGYGSCTHTSTQNNPWWRVDLLVVYDISNIIITNRGDCCAERINGAEIHIGNSLLNNGNNNPRCVVIPSMPAGASVNYTCNMIGRYVNVIIPYVSKVLSLCEVEVYGVQVHIIQCLFSHLVNLALGGIAAQSSMFNKFYPRLAIDGNTISNMSAGSCTHTNKENNPWWRVDLLAVYGIGNVIITNRGDCCPDRINGAEIRIGNSIVNNGNDNRRCVVITSIPADASVNYTCNMIGRYVNVIIPNISRILSLCEVKVYEGY